MAKPLITEINLLSETTDEESRLVQTYAVLGTDLNVENVKTAFTTAGKQLPQRGEKNPYQDSTRATVVDRVQVTAQGYQEGGASRRFNVTVNYIPQDEASVRQKDQESPDTFRFPWDKPADLNVDNDTVEVDAWGYDARDQPLIQPNGEPVNIKQTLPLTIYTITRANRADITDNGFTLNKDFFQVINDAPVTITYAGQDTTWEGRQLLCASVDINPTIFKYNDPITGQVQSIPYLEETITLIGNKRRWYERVVCRGNYYYDSEGNMRNEMFITSADGNIKERHTGPFLLNENGENLLGSTITAGKRNIENPSSGANTVNGVEVDDGPMAAVFGSVANARLVWMVFQMYEQNSFNRLRLNERMP